ncbi:MAG: lytic transglycosylase domain-containing protein [Candidatus Binatia bacterium]
MAQRNYRLGIESLSTVVPVVLLLFLLANPGRLVGESEQADAAKQHQTAKIESWLLSQDASMDGGLLADLARGILDESEKNALDPILVLAIIQVESRFDHKAVSQRGAQGLMQVKPAAVAALIDEGRIHPWQRHRSLKDPLVNVQVGASYLAFLNEMFGDLEVALTAYNWGPTRIRQKIRAKQNIPLGYATKVLSVQRTLEQQLAWKSPVFREIDSADVSAAG